MRRNLRAFAYGMLFTLFLAVVPFRILGLAGVTLFAHPGQPRFTQDDSQFWTAIDLEERLEGMGWSVSYVSRPMIDTQPVFGLTNPMLHQIIVDADLHWSARAAVLAHEAGHTLQPAWVGTAEGDCFAEGVSALVVRDGLMDHARYMAPARWTCAFFMLAEFPSMYHAAHVLLD